MNALQPNTSLSTTLIGATGFDLPALYQQVLEQGWPPGSPWQLLRGDAFLALYRDLNARLADRLQPHAGDAGRLLLPFARRADTGVVACFQAIPKSSQVLLLDLGRSDRLEVTVDPRQGAEIKALACFEDWLRMASQGTTTIEPLPFETTPENESDSRSSTRRHLMSVLRETEVNLDFVVAEAGDQPISSASARRHHGRVKEARGEQIYADMLFVLTQHRYPSRVAKWLWTKILAHKRELAQSLGRQVEITVASLDFLNRHESLIEGSLVLCREDELTQAADVALRDGLTGLFDQATFRARLARELERVRRYPAPLSLLMLDLDHFKRINDAHGHLEGDRVLAAMGPLLRGALRSIDVPARYGGEEFGVLLPETSLDDAARLGERLRRAVEERFASLGVTVSVGVATCPGGGSDPEDLIEAADQALYRSKAAGRNRLTCGALPSPAGGRNPRL